MPISWTLFKRCTSTWSRVYFCHHCLTLINSIPTFAHQASANSSQETKMFGRTVDFLLSHTVPLSFMSLLEFKLSYRPRNLLGCLVWDLRMFSVTALDNTGWISKGKRGKANITGNTSDLWEWKCLYFQELSILHFIRVLTNTSSPMHRIQFFCFHHSHFYFRYLLRLCIKVIIYGAVTLYREINLIQDT